MLDFFTGRKISMEFLNQLGVRDNNAGACFGFGEWSTTTDAGQVESINPATGEVIATVGDQPADEQGLYFELRNNGRAIDPAVWIDRS